MGPSVIVDTCIAFWSINILSPQILRSASGGRLEVHLGDAKHFDIAGIFPLDCSRPWLQSIPNMNIVGNLPFNVSLGLLLQWLEQISNRSGPWQHGRVPMTLTFQHEVAERLLADRNSEHRCRLSIMCQHLCKVRYRYQIPGKKILYHALWENCMVTAMLASLNECPSSYTVSPRYSGIQFTSIFD
jgi:hypothetical protein